MNLIRARFSSTWFFTLIAISTFDQALGWCNESNDLNMANAIQVIERLESNIGRFELEFKETVTLVPGGLVENSNQADGIEDFETTVFGFVKCSSDGEISRTMLSCETNYRFEGKEIFKVHPIEALGHPGLLVQLYHEPSIIDDDRKIDDDQLHLSAEICENKSILHIPTISFDLVLGISTADDLYLTDILKNGELEISTTKNNNRLLTCVNAKYGNYEIEFAQNSDGRWLPNGITVIKQAHHQFENKTVGDFLASPRGECVQSIRRCMEIQWTELNEGDFVPVALIAIEEMTDEVGHNVLTKSPVTLKWSKAGKLPQKKAFFSIAKIENGHQVRVEGQENIRFEYHDGEIYKMNDEGRLESLEGTILNDVSLWNRYGTFVLLLIGLFLVFAIVWIKKSRE